MGIQYIVPAGKVAIVSMDIEESRDRGCGTGTSLSMVVSIPPGSNYNYQC